MGKKSTLTRILAVAGTVLVWLPVLVMLGRGIFRLVQTGVFFIDYLTPAELFPLFILGVALLIWALLRVKLPGMLVWWGAGLSALFFIGINVLAMVTGLASGETKAEGFPLYLVLGCLVLYLLAMLLTAVGGIVFTRKLYR